MDWMDGLLFPIMVAVAWIMVRFHDLLTATGLDPAGGAAWGLSIVGLVIVIRILLIPLFFKQIKASRGLQLVQPEMQALQKKYKGRTDPASREAQSREMMELYRKHGTNPFASCLPLLLQSPIFFALFRVLYELPRLADGTYPRGDSIGPMTQELARQAEAATIFGAPLSGTFMQADGNVNIMIVTVLLIVAMSVTTFTTQRQLTMKNMPPAALQGPMAQQQKILLYVLPLVFAFSGVNFPIGVLIYWTTTNLWSMGQQFYTIRRMPAPGSAAETAMKERKARKAARRGATIEEPAGGGVAVIEEKPRTGQRQQPKRKDRARTKPVAGVSAATTPAPAAPVEQPARDVTDAAPGGSTRPAGGAKGAATGGKARPKGPKSGGARPGGATRAPGTSSGTGASDGPDAS